MPVPTGPMLKDLPMYNCCQHCKVAYCPDNAGHYVPCRHVGCYGQNVKIS